MGQIAKHSVLIDGHKTSVSLEPEFWQALTEVATNEGRSLNALIGDVDRGRVGNLSSALRLYALAYFRRQAKAPCTPIAATPGQAPPA